MQPVIYLDVFFALNFLMDFFLLLITRRICVSVKPIYRLAAAAAIGAIYSCIIVIIKIRYSMLEIIFTYLIAAVLMVVTSFGYITIKALIKQTGLLYAVTFLACGIVNAVYYRSRFGAVIDYAAQYEIVSGVNLTIFIAGIIIVASVLEALLRLALSGMGRYKDIYIVTLFNNERTTRLRAMVDTGNNLFDPISGKPVSVVNCGDILQVMEGDDRTDEKFRAIPFHSVGKKNGMMEAYRIDCLEINKNGEIFRIDNPIVAVYKGELSGNGEYEMLLNQKLINS